MAAPVGVLRVGAAAPRPPRVEHAVPGLVADLRPTKIEAPTPTRTPDNQFTKFRCN